MQILEPFHSFILLFAQWWIYWGPWVLPLIIAFFVWVILVVINRILSKKLRRRALDIGVPPDAVNGVLFAVRLIFLYIGLAVFIIALPPDFTASLVPILGGTSLLIGTAVGFAIGQAARNFVSGLYVMLTRPFHVRDYVRIGEIEGIVREISINYTEIRQQDGSTVLVPNSEVLDSPVTNFLYDKSKLQLEEEAFTQNDSLRRRVLRRVGQVLETEKVVRYVFTLSFHVNNDFASLTKAFDEVCNNWADKFGFLPMHELTDANQFAFTFLFIIFLDNPRKILEYKSAFIHDIIQSVYSKA